MSMFNAEVEYDGDCQELNITIVGIIVLIITALGRIMPYHKGALQYVTGRETKEGSM